jgi:hypothetical protein
MLEEQEQDYQEAPSAAIEGEVGDSAGEINTEQAQEEERRFDIDEEQVRMESTWAFTEEDVADVPRKTQVLDQRLKAKRDMFSIDRVDTINIIGTKQEKIAKEEQQIHATKEASDPTEILSFLPPVDSALASNLTETWSEALMRQRVLVLDCFDLEILFNAGYSIVRCFKGERRLLTFQEEEGQEASIDGFLTWKEQWEPPTLVLVEAIGLNGQRFIDSLAGTQGWLLKAQNRLDQCGAYLLILTTPSHLALIGDGSLSCYHVPYIEPRLHEWFPEQAADFSEEIKQQRVLGLWGRGEKEFWERFSSFLKHENLEQEIEKRKRARLDPHPHRVRPETKPILILGAELDNTVIFVAAFFPNLPVEDYQDVLLRLLGDRLVPMKQPPPPLGEEGAVNLDRGVSRTLADEWHENYREVCQRCRIQFWRDTAVTSTAFSYSVRGVVVDFDTPDVREQVCDEFLTTHYPTLTRLYGRVLEERLLFHSSSSVVEGTLQFLETMASVNPHRYGSKMLLGLKADAQEASPPEQRVHDGVPNRIDAKLLLNRLYLLVRILLTRPTLREIVHQFFTDLINQARHEDLLELVRRLRFAAGFDQVYWWKQLLDRGEYGAKERTSEAMFAVLQSGGNQLQETLLAIRKWLPESGQEAKSESSRRGNRLLMELFEESMFRPKSLTQPSPLRDGLKSALCETEPSDAANSSILGWLFHESFIRQMQEHRSRHLNMVVWKWVLITSVKRYLHADPNNIASRWFGRFKNLPLNSFPFLPQAPSALAFQALVLGDLASTINDGRSNTDVHQGNPLRPIAETVAKLCTNEQRLLLESYWGEMMSCLLEVHEAIRPQGGIEDETFRATRTRLEQQYEGAAELKEMFSEIVDQLSATGE